MIFKLTLFNSTVKPGYLTIFRTNEHTQKELFSEVNVIKQILYNVIENRLELQKNLTSYIEDMETLKTKYYETKAIIEDFLNNENRTTSNYCLRDFVLNLKYK